MTPPPYLIRWADAVERRPVAAALVTTAVLLPVIVLLAYQWASAGPPVPIDYSVFGPSGAAVLEGRWDQVFRASVVQAGPLELLPYGAAHLLGVTSPGAWTVFYTVVIAALTFGVVLLARPAGRRAVLAGAACAALGCAQALLPRSVLLGHPAEVVIPLLWLTAASLAQRNRVMAASAVVALSAGLEVWGVLGAVVVLLAERPRLLRAAAVAAGVIALLYGPFAATGHFAMFGYHWRVGSASLFHLLQPRMRVFPWSLRLLQGAAALAAGGTTASLLRRSRWAPWLVVLVVLGARLLLDPVAFEYYWMAPWIVVVALLAAAAVRRNLPVLGLGAAGGLVCSVPMPMALRAVALLVLVVPASITVGVRARRRPTTRQAEAGSARVAALEVVAQR